MTCRVLMSAMRRKGLPHLAHLTSIEKVLRKSSAHGRYLDLRAGFSVAAAAAVGLGTTRVRERLCEESTPQ